MVHHWLTFDEVLRWTARLLGLVIIVVFGIFLAGGSFGGTLLSRSESLMMVALFVALAGILTAWRHEGLGGALTLAGISAFYLLNYVTYGRWAGGFIFPLIAVPGLLSVVCWWRSGRV